MTLPFEPAWIDAVQVHFNTEQAYPRHLAYVCLYGSVTHCTSTTTIYIEPLLGSDADLLRNVLAHESYHMYFGRAHAGVDDPDDERGAYAFGCNVHWVDYCNAWLRGLR